MPNIQKLYSESIGRKPLVEASSIHLSPTEESTRKQLKINWLESTITQEIFKELVEEANSLEEAARQLALTYHTTKNHDAIIQNLIRASEIRKILTKYASSST